MRRESHGKGGGGEARIEADAPPAASAFQAKCSDEGKGGEGKQEAEAVVGDGGEADLAATVSHAESLKQQGNRHYKKQEWAEAVMW